MRTRFRRVRRYSKAVPGVATSHPVLDVFSVKGMLDLAPAKVWAIPYFLGWAYVIAKVMGF